MPLIKNEHTAPGRVTVRANAVDEFKGLRGAAYINARRLDKPVKRLDPHAEQRADAVANILAAERARRAPLIKAIAISADGQVQHLELAPVISLTLAKLRMCRP